MPKRIATIRKGIPISTKLKIANTEMNSHSVISRFSDSSACSRTKGSLGRAASTTIGITIGAIAGYMGGWVDEALMRLTEVLMSFPGVLLAILIIFITQEPSMVAVIGALSVSGWAGYARLVRGQVLSEREREYVEAARALGLHPARVLFGHVLPNVIAPVIVQATFGLAGAILAEASLSFLGLGPQDQPSWGALLDQGASFFLLTPHLAIVPGVAIMLTVLGVNFLGDGLRDALDPRTVTAHS